MADSFQMYLRMSRASTQRNATFFGEPVPRSGIIVCILDIWPAERNEQQLARQMHRGTVVARKEVQQRPLVRRCSM